MSLKFVLIVIAIAMLNVAFAQSFHVMERSCEGNFLIAKVRETDGSIGYRILDFCPYGCKYGICLSKKEVPEVRIREIYNVKACIDNIIFVSLSNVGGTKGEISLTVSGEASKWIRYPEKVSIGVNETKTIAIIASIPCNVTRGIYPFMLIGSGISNFYAPSALSIESTETIRLPITTTVTQVDLKFALVVAALIVAIYLGFRYNFKKTEEERFDE